MPIILKPGDVLNDFVVAEQTDSEVIALHYSACSRLTDSKARIRQYTSPGSTCRGYAAFVKSQSAVLKALAEHPDAAKHTLKVHGMFHGIPLRGADHHEVILATEVAPPRLQELLSSGTLDAPRRLALACSVARGVAALHKAGIAWGLIDPWHIGVQADGQPVFLEQHCARVIAEWQSWDFPFPVEHFAAPELVEGEDSSLATDVYALAVTVACLLAGDPAADVLPLGDDFPSLASLPAAARAGAEQLLRAALSLDPASRPAAEDLANALYGLGAQHAAALLPDAPPWIGGPMQALAFWVGYQHVVYRHHLLPEGAIVAEFTRLLDGEIGNQTVVMREPMYRDLSSAGGGQWEDGARCDLAVRQKGAGRAHGPVLAAVEVKRGVASNAVIDADLVALHQLKQVAPSIRAFMVLVSQASWPRRWVTAEGMARREVDTIALSKPGQADTEVRVRVRRVTKAASSFNSTHSATYCGLLEVV